MFASGRYAYLHRRERVSTQFYIDCVGYPARSRVSASQDTQPVDVLLGMWLYFPQLVSDAGIV